MRNAAVSTRHDGVSRCFVCREPVYWFAIDGILTAIDVEPVPWGDIERTGKATAVIREPEVAPNGLRFQPHSDMCGGRRE